ncbi:MAG: preprotein translocase subunit SecG [Pseudomonadota bacterium]
MSTVETVLVMLLVIDALALIALVMLQQGKGADVGAAFGSGSANTVFGSAGSTSFITRLTVWLAVGFFGISFGLAYIAKEKAEGLDSLGLPTIEAPAVLPEAAEEPLPELTNEAEGVDSDVPDI